MIKIVVGDCRDSLRLMPAASVHCIVTSPPYFGLRSYFDADDALKAIEIGTEKTIQEYVGNLVDVFRELWRVLRADGTVWLNLADSYANDGKWGGESRIGREKIRTGLKPKDLCGIPWRVAFALQDNGWWLRQDLIWNKPAPMPESVLDRCTKSHEYIFLLTKSPTYFYDAEAIAEPAVGTNKHDLTGAGYSAPGQIPQNGNRSWKGSSFDSPRGLLVHPDIGRNRSGVPKRSGNLHRVKPTERGGVEGGGNQCASVPWEGATRNKRDVWTVNTQPFGGEFCRACGTYFEGDTLNALRVEIVEHKDGKKERRRWCNCGAHDRWLSHFACFPPELVEAPIKAGTSEHGCCARCGSPWKRDTERIDQGFDGSEYGERAVEATGGAIGGGTAKSTLGSGNGKLVGQRETVGWSPTCDCSPQTEGGKLARAVVLDPFAGAGTSGLVADRLGRDAVLLEANPDYACMIEQRIKRDGGMFTQVEKMIAATKAEAAE